MSKRNLLGYASPNKSELDENKKESISFKFEFCSLETGQCIAEVSYVRQQTDNCHLRKKFCLYFFISFVE